MEFDTTNDTNRIRLLLEACLMRKVEIHMIKSINKVEEDPPDEICYNVWLYTYEVLSSIIKSSEYHSKNQISSNIKFKLGSIIYDDLQETNNQLHQNNLGGLNQNSLYIILASAYVGRAQTYITDEDPRDIKDFKFNSNDNTEIYYLNGKPNEENSNISTYHWYLTRDNRKLVYNYLVQFSLDKSELQCFTHGCTNTDLKYCHNDKKFFCVNCVDDYHNKLNFNVLKSHKITPAMTFSITYSSTCNEHKIKQLDFFCFNCNAVYCTKCLDVGGIHNQITYKDHEVKFLNEVFNSFELEMKTLMERIKEMNYAIDNEIDKRKASSKEVQKLFKAYSQSIMERLNKSQEELESEILFRTTYLASILMELQRIIAEIESKINFVKNQYHNADQSTFIAMTLMFNRYMKEEVIPNLEMLCNVNFEGISSSLYRIEKKEQNDILKI